MSLLDRLREAQAEPARHRASPYVGPSILSVEQLRAMERALEREGFFDRETTAPEVLSEFLPVWTPPVFESAPAAPPPLAPVVEPLPIWTPPVFEPSAPTAFDPCPNCGEEVAIDRVDLTANASWVTCRACGLRWGGSIAQSVAERAPRIPALPTAGEKSGERGRMAAG